MLYTKALEMAPHSSHLYLGRGKAQFYDGKLLLAIEDYRTAVTKDPKNREAVDRLQQLTAEHQGVVTAVLKKATRRKSDAVRFPTVPSSSSSMSIKTIPGRGKRGEFVPQSFGAGFRVMPKADIKKAAKTNQLRTRRPLP